LTLIALFCCAFGVSVPTTQRLIWVVVSMPD
jgi:hypothetical protein